MGNLASYNWKEVILKYSNNIFCQKSRYPAHGWMQYSFHNSVYEWVQAYVSCPLAIKLPLKCFR